MSFRVFRFPAVPSLVAVFLLATCSSRREAIVVPETSNEYAETSVLPLESASGHVILVNDTSAGNPFGFSDELPGPDLSRAEKVMTSLKLGYSNRITETAYRDGDWACRIGDEWFYWANGRLLTGSERKNWEKYDAYSFYTYTSELLPVPTYSKEEKERLRTAVERMDRNPVTRRPGFANALWRIRDRESGWNMVKTTYFLGHKLQVHREILEDLAAVEEEILFEMKKDPSLAKYVGTIVELNGYNWRPIAGTSSLSFHAYGTAVDLIVKYYGGKQVYWRWAMDAVPEWFSLPYSGRYTPHPSFIRAFENHGFVWGGKWLFYDTIHFEYRPDIFYLNDIPITH